MTEKLVPTMHQWQVARDVFNRSNSLPTWGKVCQIIEAFLAAAPAEPQADIASPQGAAEPAPAAAACKAVRAEKGGTHKPSEYRWCSPCGVLLRDDESCSKAPAAIRATWPAEKKIGAHDMAVARTSDLTQPSSETSALPPADGVTLTMKQEKIEEWRHILITNFTADDSITDEANREELNALCDQALAALRIPGLEREIAEAKRYGNISQEMYHEQFEHAESAERERDELKAALARFENAEMPEEPDIVAACRKVNLPGTWNAMIVQYSDALRTYAAKLSAKLAEFENAELPVKPHPWYDDDSEPHYNALHAYTAKLSAKLAEWERPCENVEEKVCTSNLYGDFVPADIARKLAAQLRNANKIISGFKMRVGGNLAHTCSCRFDADDKPLAQCDRHREMEEQLRAEREQNVNLTEQTTNYLRQAREANEELAAANAHAEQIAAVTIRKCKSLLNARYCSGLIGHSNNDKEREYFAGVKNTVEIVCLQFDKLSPADLTEQARKVMEDAENYRWLKERQFCWRDTISSVRDWVGRDAADADFALKVARGKEKTE